MLPLMLGRFYCLVIDCPDPRHLAAFYEQLLGLQRVEDAPDWVTSADTDGAVRLAFQRVERFVPPRWPHPEAPQQMHVDVMVANLDVGEAAALRLGATLLEGSDKPIGYRVYADPVGHPFCLVTPESVA